eukprot:TRINITY_DN73247_c0_g1_i1.p1 TRINITY_DN73247_c0_g1~~TRINITY_DN73247_c0_g1_i1.p1  ORF type:complete len:544 (+),score=109.28 TRINITY_DN73247_c0_g1_i1:112-1743(+)
MADDGWDLFGDDGEAAPMSSPSAGADTQSACDDAASSSAAVLGVLAAEHPYFKTCPTTSRDAAVRSAVSLFADVQSAIDEYLPTACEMLAADADGQRLRGLVRSAVSACRQLSRTASEATAAACRTAEDAASACATEAFSQLQAGMRSESLVYAHSFGHAIIAVGLLCRAGDSGMEAAGVEAAQADAKRSRLADDVHSSLPQNVDVALAHEALRHADLALLLSPDLPIQMLHTLAARCAAVCGACALPSAIEENATWTIPSELRASSKVPKLSHAILRESYTSLPVTRFRSERLQQAHPVVVEGHLRAAGWAALDKWADLRFWLRSHGKRLVPVELGVREDDAANHALSSSRENEGSMKLEDFVSRFLLPSNEASSASTALPGEAGPADEWTASPVAYLAQHLMLFQMPELQKDIAVPQYCALGSLRTVNIWLGTVGTVTGLHYDNDENFLVQVAGFKYVRLYSQGESKRLYATTAPRDKCASHGASFSQVRVERPDLEAHPLFAEAEYQETILGPGDMLYIPRYTWHYIRSLSTSLSVNFWF